jgi:hypothetical protein
MERRTQSSRISHARAGVNDTYTLVMTIRPPAAWSNRSLPSAKSKGLASFCETWEEVPETWAPARVSVRLLFSSSQLSRNRIEEII